MEGQEVGVGWPEGRPQERPGSGAPPVGRGLAEAVASESRVAPGPAVRCFSLEYCK